MNFMFFLLYFQIYFYGFRKCKVFFFSLNEWMKLDVIQLKCDWSSFYSIIWYSTTKTKTTTTIIYHCQQNDIRSINNKKNLILSIHSFISTNNFSSFFIAFCLYFIIFVPLMIIFAKFELLHFETWLFGGHHYHHR